MFGLRAGGFGASHVHGTTGRDVTTRSYYLAIEPPARERGLLSRLMRRLGDSSPTPHVTVIAPPQLCEDLSWWPAVNEVMHTTAPMSIAVSEPRTFDNRVLYLSVEAPMLEDARAQLLQAVHAATSEAVRDHDHRHFIPHLTLAVARRGRPLPTLDDVRPLLFEIGSFEATGMTLFRRDGAAEPYRPWRRLAFEHA